MKGDRMSGFDIENLLEFHPARSWCLNCLALWEDVPSKHFFLDDKTDYNGFLIERSQNFLKCKVCGVKYIGTEHYSVDRTHEFIEIESEISLPLDRKSVV